MIFQDMNRSWNPPENSYFVNVVADGVYLKVKYCQATATGENVVVIYVNDMGREVARSITEILRPVLPVDASIVHPPITHWARFCTGFYLTLAGLQEMIKCLKK